MFPILRRYLSTSFEILFVHAITSILLTLDLYNSVPLLMSFDGYPWSYKTHFFVMPVVIMYVISLLFELSPWKRSVGKFFVKLRVRKKYHKTRYHVVQVTLKYLLLFVLYFFLSKTISLNALFIHEHLLVSLCFILFFYVVYGFVLNIEFVRLRYRKQQEFYEYNTKSVKFKRIRGVLKTVTLLSISLAILFVLVLNALINNPDTVINKSIRKNYNQYHRFTVNDSADISIVEKATAQIQMWINRGFDFNRDTDTHVRKYIYMLVDFVLSQNKTVTNFLDINYKSSFGPYQSDNKHNTIYHSMNHVPLSQSKKYIVWVKNNPDMDFKLLMAICFEDPYTDYWTTLLQMQNKHGEYIFDVNTQFGNKADTLLHKAVGFGDEDVIKHILSRSNVNPNIVNLHGETALDIAYKVASIEIINLLGGELFDAVMLYDFVRKGDFINALEIIETSSEPLGYFVDAHNRNTLLLAMSILVHIDMSTEDQEYVLNVWDMDMNLLEKMILKMIDNVDFDINCEDNSGMTALNLSIRYWNENLLEKVIESGADVNHINKNKWTTLEYVTAFHFQNMDSDISTNNQYKVLKRAGSHDTFFTYLLSNDYPNVEQSIISGVDPNQLIQGKTMTLLELNDNSSWHPLHFTAYLGHKEITALLLSHDVDINVQTDNGHTPLYIAVENGRIDLANYLIENGADTSIHDSFGRTALDAGDADVVGQLNLKK
jgi:ankyrin repeat protein